MERSDVIPHAAIILAYALYDAEHTSRLGEQGAEVQDQYFHRARKLLYTLDYRPADELQVLASYIATIKDKPMTTNLTLTEAVTARLGSSIPALTDKIIDSLVEKTLVTRQSTAVQALAQIDAAEKEQKKLMRKPANVLYNADGSEASSSYTKEQIDSNKKLLEKIEKITRLLDKAFTENNDDAWTKLAQGVQ